MKRTLRVGLMVLLTAVLGVGNAWGERKVWTDGNGVQWKYEEIEPGKTCRIWPKDRNSVSGRVDIPGAVEVEGVSIKVVSIGDYAFYSWSSLTSLTIPAGVTQIELRAFANCIMLNSIEVESGNGSFFADDGVLFTNDKATLACFPAGKKAEEYAIPGSVTAIGGSAFAGCFGLRSVSIPSSVTEIGGGAFEDCNGLRSVSIPSSVTEIGWGAFFGCSGLKRVTLSDSVKSIGRYAFYGCGSLTEVTIPEGVTAIGNYAFSACSSLSEVTIPAGVTKIGSGAFGGCSGLKRVTLPDGVKSIGSYAFQDCKELMEVTIPNSVTEIGRGAFDRCSGLKRVTLPDGVKSIGSDAFQDCKELMEVTIPSSVTAIGDYAFGGCSNLKSIAVESGNEKYCAEDGVLFTKDKTTIICYPSGKVGEYTIPGSVTAIGDYAFYGCNGLNRVTISDGVNAIGIYAFAKCKELTEVNIPRSVKVVAEGTFYGCIGLTEVSLPETMTEIGGSAFEGCRGLKEVTIPIGVTTVGEAAFYYSGLTAVTIPASVTRIGDGAFSNCSDLKSIAVESGNEEYCAADGVLFTKDKKTLICYPGGKAGKYRIYSGVTAIWNSAFKGCGKLEALEVEEGNEKYCAADGVLFTKEMQQLVCYPAGRKAEKYTIPDGVSEIGFAAFYGCRGLSEVIIPIGVTTIAHWAFYDCSGLTRVTIPEGVTEVRLRAFENCKALSEVYWLAGVGCEVGYDVFYKIAKLATLYVRQGEKEAIEIKWELRGYFSDVVEGYVVTLKDADGNRLGEQLVKPNGTADEPQAPARKGFIFKGWYLDGAKYLFTTPVTRDIHLVAQWEADPSAPQPSTYTVSFNANGGAPTPNTQQVAPNGTADEPQAPTRAGFTFKGWYQDGAKYDFTAPVTRDITLVAAWEAVPKYTVSFDAKGGAPTPDAQTVEEGKPAAVPVAPTREGFTFKGWYLDGAKYDFTAPVTRDITLVAVWKKKDDSGTAVESAQLAEVRVVRNPVGEVLELEGMERAVRVEVYSASGVRLYAESLHGAERVEIDARGWASGVYVVRVVASDGAKTLRVMK